MLIWTKYYIILFFNDQKLRIIYGKITEIYFFRSPRAWLPWHCTRAFSRSRGWISVVFLLFQQWFAVPASQGRNSKACRGNVIILINKKKKKRAIINLAVLPTQQTRASDISVNHHQNQIVDASAVFESMAASHGVAFQTVQRAPSSV